MHFPLWASHTWHCKFLREVQALSSTIIAPGCLPPPRSPRLLLTLPTVMLAFGPWLGCIHGCIQSRRVRQASLHNPKSDCCERGPRTQAFTPARIPQTGNAKLARTIDTFTERMREAEIFGRTSNAENDSGFDVGSSCQKTPVHADCNSREFPRYDL